MLQTWRDRKPILYALARRRTGWGAEYLPEIRNGESEYQAFTEDKKPDGTANLVACFQCHKSHANNDYLQTFDQLKAAAVK